MALDGEAAPAAGAAAGETDTDCNAETDGGAEVETDCGAEVQTEVHDVEAETEVEAPAEGNDAETEAECTAPAAATGRTACIVINADRHDDASQMTAAARGGTGAALLGQRAVRRLPPRPVNYPRSGGSTGRGGCALLPIGMKMPRR